MIRHHGPIQIPDPLREYADTIKLQRSYHLVQKSGEVQSFDSHAQ